MLARVRSSQGSVLTLAGSAERPANWCQCHWPCRCALPQVGGIRVRQHVNPLKKDLQVPTQPLNWAEAYEGERAPGRAGGRRGRRAGVLTGQQRLENMYGRAECSEWDAERITGGLAAGCVWMGGLAQGEHERRAAPSRGLALPDATACSAPACQTRPCRWSWTSAVATAASPSRSAREFLAGVSASEHMHPGPPPPHAVAALPHCCSMQPPAAAACAPGR